MNLDEAITILLGLVALACYLVLVALRIRDDRAGSRFLFADVLLTLAAIEVLADTLGLHPVALLVQGAVMAGGAALLATYHRGGY